SSSDEGSSSSSNGTGTDSSSGGEGADGATINTDFLPAPGIIVSGISITVAAIMRRQELQSQK
ncbi:MAG: hypothetical protein NZ777_15095, partial [Pseudomonadales bacterium]|nr:hypothetical protein [Pseudomonadales bacterium]